MKAAIVSRKALSPGSRVKCSGTASANNSSWMYTRMRRSALAGDNDYDDNNNNNEEEEEKEEEEDDN